MIETQAMLFTLILARVATLLVFMPIFTRMRLPQLVKAGLAVALSVAVWLSVLETSVNANVRIDLSRWHWADMGFAIGKEVVFGAGLGFFISLFLEPARIAGTYIGQEMGFSIGAVADPTVQSTSSVVGQLFDTVALAFMFAANLHHYMFAIIYVSFTRWPVGDSHQAVPFSEVVQQVDRIHQQGLLVAGPVGAVLLMLTLAVAMLTRVSNQLNIFTVGLPLRAAVGIVAMMVYFPTIAAVILRTIYQLAYLWR